VKLDAGRLRRFVREVEFSDFARIIRARYAHDPKGLSSGPSRFSSPTGAFKVLYAAEDFPTALAEAVIRDRFVERTRRYIGLQTLEARAVTLISATAPLNLIDVRGDAAYALGVDTDATRARAHTAGQALSEALHRLTDADGLLYGSRLKDRACVAIYDRALAQIAASVAIPLVAHGELTAELTRLEIIVRRPAAA
jgi:hypothetical protein